MRMDGKTRLRRFLSEESGQTTTEYILMLVVVVTIFMKFKKQLTAVIDGLFGGLNQAAQQATQDITSGGDF